MLADPAKIHEPKDGSRKVAALGLFIGNSAVDLFRFRPARDRDRHRLGSSIVTSSEVSEGGFCR